MGVAPLTDEQLQEVVSALREANGNKTEAARYLGLSPTTFRDRVKVAAKRGFLGTKPVLPGFAISKTTTVRDEDGNTVREFIQQRPENGGPFNLPDGHSIKGVSAYLDASGNVIQQWVKTRADDSSSILIEAAKAAFESYEGTRAPTAPPERTSDALLSVYPVADAHHGLLAWKPETGENYDLEISANRLFTCMSDLISQSPPSREALILNLGDYFHNNDRTNATPASKNQLDVDGRYFKVVQTGVELFCRLIDLALQKHEIVTVRNLPGNHDPDASIILTIALGAFYRNEPRVVVEQDPSELFFRLFGKTLIGACHGHKMKPERMAMTMATMRAEDWGKAKYRWFLFGHIHHETAKEVGDVRCESFQTLAGRDAYHTGSGYVAGQSISSITLHEERGEIGRHRVNLPSIEAP